MFAVDAATGAIEMNVGDTGAFEVAGTRDDGDAWTEDDRAVFTVKNGAGEIVIERIYRLDDEELGNGVVLVQLHNADTDSLDPGAYTWEMRWIVRPYWDGGRIVDGDVVRTPGIDGKGMPMPMTLKAVQANI